MNPGVSEESVSMKPSAVELERFAALERENEQLRIALVSRVVIEQAKGVLAERLALSLDEAFALLRRAARSNRRQIHALAADVVGSRQTPAAIAELMPRRPHEASDLEADARSRNGTRRETTERNGTAMIGDASRRAIERVGDRASLADAREIGMLDLDIDVHRRDDASYVFALAGEVDMYTAPAFEHELVAAIANGARELVIDLTEATFIDSSFLGVLKGARQRLNARGGRISIVCENRNLTRVFEITGLDRIFSISTTLDDATSPARPPATRHRGLGLHRAAPAHRPASLSPPSSDRPSAG